MGITINGKKAKKFSDTLYSDGNAWYVICPDCHRTITKSRRYKNDIELGLTNYLREWADLEYQRHLRKESEHNDSREDIF